MTVFGEAVAAKFSKRHPQSRKPLSRFLAIVRAAIWPHFQAVKESFPSADYAPETGMIIFDISGNKYRLLSIVNFGRQDILIQEVLTHAEYDRRSL